MADEPLAVSWQLLRASAQLIEGIQEHMANKGFHDVRPLHGYAFVRISWGDTTVADVAEHLGVTKQAASQMVEQLVQLGYVARKQHPDDGRAWLLTLTARGRACTKAAEQAMTAVVSGWREQMGDRDFAALHRGLSAVVVPGPVRPPW